MSALEPRICANPNCPKPGGEFVPTKHNQRFCGDACKMQAYRARSVTDSAVTQTPEVAVDQSAVTQAPAQAAEHQEPKETAGDPSLIAQLNDRWRVVLDDSDEPQYRQ